MSEIDKISIYQLLEKIRNACKEVQEALLQLVEKTTNEAYKDATNADVVTLSNLISIADAVSDDVGKERVGACTELLLRIAANDFQKKLDMIPEKKILHVEIITALQEIQKKILPLVV